MATFIYNTTIYLVPFHNVITQSDCVLKILI